MDRGAAAQTSETAFTSAGILFAGDSNGGSGPNINVPWGRDPAVQQLRPEVARVEWQKRTGDRLEYAILTETELIVGGRPRYHLRELGAMELQLEMDATWVRLHEAVGRSPKSSTQLYAEGLRANYEADWREVFTRADARHS